MVRNYKPKPGHRSYRRYSPEVMEKAYTEYVKREGSLTMIAKKYNISKSVLYRRIRNKIHRDSGGQRAFTLEREEHIVKYIHACAPWQYQLQFWDLRLLIKCYLDKRPVITKRKLQNNLPGQELVMKFTQRHEDTISQKVIQSINENGAVTAEAIVSYFHELKMFINDIDPQNIVCFNDVHITGEFKDNIMRESDNFKMNNGFVMLAASALGEVLAPHIVYDEKPCYDRSPRKSILSKHSHQQRKRLNIGIFEDWFKSVILPYYEGKSGKKCLIGGFFSSRITKNILDMCKEQDIQFVFMPDNASHLTQPLHCLKQLIQTTFYDILSENATDRGKSKITKDFFCQLTESLIANASDSVLESFKKTGISPFNPAEVLKQLPEYNETTIEDVDEDFEKCDTRTEEEVVRVKMEIEYSDHYSDNDYDDEISSNCIENKIANEENRNNETTKLKISPVDFPEDMSNEDASVDYTQNDIMVNIDSIPRSSRGRKLKMKRKEEFTSDSDGQFQILQENPVSRRNAKNKNLMRHAEKDLKKKKTKVSSNGAEIDPLSSCPNCNNLRANDTEHGTHSHTRLLEELLSTVNRQEKLQERAATAMEAQAAALSHIAVLLERQMAPVPGMGPGNLVYP